jgi:SNF2 family DNA or RNA helicase
MLMSQDIRARTQGCRFFNKVREIQQAEYYNCDACDGQANDLGDLVVLTACGHSLCGTCSGNQQAEKCPVSGCGTLNKDYQRMSGEALGGDSTANDGSYFGTKLDAVVDLIISFGEDEKVLIFVQFEETEEKLQQALSFNGIKFCDIDCPYCQEKGMEAKTTLLVSTVWSPKSGC